jgi:ubiquitin-protein ligase
MAPPNSASAFATQRLLRELTEYTRSPNDALLHLGPASDDDLLHWEAVLKGARGTPYEGEARFDIIINMLFLVFPFRA